MQKLKILLVAHNVINNKAGAGKVHYEIKQEYEKAGHEVEKVDILDLFPKGHSTFLKIFGPSYTSKIFSYLKKNAKKYDVIDANITNIIYPKKSFGFEGLLFARSQGIMPLYIKAEESAPFQRFYSTEAKKITLRNRIGSFIRSFYKDLTIDDFNASIKYADIIHCLNQSEYNYYLESGIDKNRLILLPNGLSKQYLEDFNLKGKDRKNNKRTVAFLGGWHLVKGIKDWKEISKLLSKVKDFKHIKILGTVMAEEYVIQDFDTETIPLLKIIPTFKPDELPELLKDIKVGIFSSYMEGLPYAVLEQLASGIPVVGYNVPGVADFLLQIDPSLLVEPGNIKGLVDKAIAILEMEGNEYELLSNICMEVSKKYILENVASLFLETYYRGLDRIKCNKSCLL